jgi:adenosylcobinamide-phosphate synthase
VGTLAGRGPSIALAIDLLFGEPPAELHPTVWLGHCLGAGRRHRASHTPAASLIEGALLVGGTALIAAAAGLAIDRVLTHLPRARRPLARGLALKPALALRALLGAASEVEGALRAGDLPDARRLLGYHLVSRPTASLSAADVASATISSLAENLNDSVVAPILAYRVGGLGAAYAYRAINTADAMFGYRTPELEWFGKAAARTDDVINWVPARLTALLVAAAALAVGGSPRVALATARADARRCPSPNGGWPMAAAAGALGVVLTKHGAYTLNADGRAPRADDIGRARLLVAVAATIAAVAAESA